MKNENNSIQGSKLDCKKFYVYKIALVWISFILYNEIVILTIISRGEGVSATPFKFYYNFIFYNKTKTNVQ